VKAPEEIRRDDLIQRFDIALEQGAGKTFEQFIAFGGRGNHAIHAFGFERRLVGMT
jgi:hypothetical protein